MKFLTPLFLLFLSFVNAHYNFPSMNTGSAWSNVRQWSGYYTFDPVVNVLSPDIRCNANASFAPNTLSVAAGSVLKWAANPDIYHPGPLLAYMAKVPTNKTGLTAANWDGAGEVWFKIYEDRPTGGSAGLVWPSNSMTPFSLPLSSYLP